MRGLADFAPVHSYEDDDPEAEIEEAERMEVLPLIEKCWLLCHLDKYDVEYVFRLFLLFCGVLD